MMPWRLVHSLKTTCSGGDFYSSVDVWIRRPNVVNRKLLGAVIRLEAPLSPAWASKDPIADGHVTVGELHQEPEQGGVASGSRVVVRELLPRLGHVPPTLELVVIGTGEPCLVVIAEHPISLMLLQITAVAM